MAEISFLNPTEALGASALREGMLVADFGAGSGFFTRAAARMVGPEGCVWAVDAHRDLLPRIKNLAAAEGLNNVEVMYGDLAHESGSNLPAVHFDFGICANLMFAVEDRGLLAAEVGRVLKKGGRALVIDWAGSFGGLGPRAEDVVSAAAARAAFEEAGFAYIGEAPAGAYHWGFLVRKK